MATSKKTTAKKSAAKSAAKNGKAKPIKPLHAKMIALMSRPTGADLHELKKAGWKAAAMAALKLVERKGYKTNVVTKKGELARYVARKA
jgi:hypothetical protein